jgi:flagellar hook capping protein FlgD
VTVTNSANGCTSSASALVDENITPPGASATGGTLTCTITSVSLSASTTSGTSFSWAGPGIVSGGTTATPVVSASGTYTVTVTNSANGCTSSASALVDANITPPGASATGGTLTCTITSVSLSASTTSGTSFSWAGPGIVSGGTSATPVVSASGTYTVTVTNSANGCASSASALVDENTTPPGASATGGTLTCPATSTSLSAATTSGTGFSWAGPGIVSGGTTATPVVSASGTYTVTVTNSANGCTSSASAEVTFVPCTGNIFPTGTTCQMFTTGTAVNLDSTCYQFSTSGGTSTVTNAQPGVFFYYASVVAPGPTFTINLVETKSVASFKPIHLNQGHVWLYSADCISSHSFTKVELANGSVVFSVTGATTGATYIISAQYSVKSMVGSTFTGAAPDVSYGFSTNINGGAPFGIDALLMKSGCTGGSTVGQTLQDANGEESSVSAIPTEYALHENYPNPFNPTTLIKYDLPEASTVTLSVFNILGEKVATLVDGEVAAGYQTVEWNAGNSSGVSVPSGIYLYRLQVTSLNGREFHEVRKMVLMK